jgi:hypothetical protein
MDVECKRSEPDLMERLTNRRSATARELQQLDDAIAAMKANPVITDVLVKISRVTDRLR